MGQAELTKGISPMDKVYAVLPLRDVVVYPHMVIPLFVGRAKSIAALDSAMALHKQIFLVAQKDAGNDDPTIGDVYDVGCIATILQLLKLPDGTVKVLVEGIERAKALHYEEHVDYLSARVDLIKETEFSGREADVISRSVLTQFEQYVKLNKKIPPEILTALAGIEEPARLADTIAAHMSIKLDAKQAVLAESHPQKRLEMLMGLMDDEIDILQVEKNIRRRVKRQMEKSQRDYYLNEQMKAIQKELGDAENGPSELERLQAKIEKAGLSKEAKEKANEELNKLKLMSPMSAEATVSRNYLDVLVNLPWKKKSKIKHDLANAEKILEEDHYGLEKVKERIIEYLAVQQRVKKLKGPVLCLVGPPGVGKTSLGQSIARSTGRHFVRMSLGGVRDEAEIRGHRRTYIGALPGKVLQKLAKTEVNNPLFLLDEVDKMAMDYRGDPASALLEVLDPEQNHTFNDHYLEVDYDLSEIMFVCTANSMNIPSPLLDRMEVIRIPGYTEIEKLHIAEKHLISKQIAQHGLRKGELTIETEALREIIHSYTREAGVRNLEREISKLCRKVVKELLLNPKQKTRRITVRNLEKYLGVKRFRHDIASKENQVGQVNGLAWTEVGGELLTIEAATVPGKGKVTCTGQLGDVMQESIQAASTVVRSRAASLGITREFYEKHDMHIHVPEGATPKDGPSAGIGMCTAIVSALTGIPVRSDVAMTGEITLRGEVLPIGGLKEKLLAAARSGIKKVIIPEENRRDLKEISEVITEGLTIHPVRWIDEVLAHALTAIPQPCEDEAGEAEVKTNPSSRRGNKGRGKSGGKPATH
ncbi:MAG: DNA-binding protein [Gammaproteobacteria bacterium]|jgi:ATP-dependent Lon protease|nr:DNA-binding protein [Gammaproteobacteria bacterium]